MVGISIYGSLRGVARFPVSYVSHLLAEHFKSSAQTYLSKRLRQQRQTKGALTNTKVLLVSVLKNATFFLTNQLSTDLKFGLPSKGL